MRGSRQVADVRGEKRTEEKKKVTSPCPECTFITRKWRARSRCAHLRMVVSHTLAKNLRRSCHNPGTANDRINDGSMIVWEYRGASDTELQ